MIVGLGRFRANLAKLERGTRGKLLEKACLAGALLISNKAKDNAPYITGTLKRSIHVGNYVSESSPGFTPSDIAGSYSDLGGKEVSASRATLLVGTNLVYAPFQEFGTSKMSARPYLRPALASEEKAVKNEIGDAVAALIKQALG